MGDKIIDSNNECEHIWRRSDYRKRLWDFWKSRYYW